MEYAYFIITLAFSVLMFLYAGLLHHEKSIDLIPKSQFSKINDKEKYAVQFSKLIALISLAPLLSGIVSLFAPVPVAIIVLITIFILAMRHGIKMMDGI